MNPHEAYMYMSTWLTVAEVHTASHAAPIAANTHSGPCRQAATAYDSPLRATHTQATRATHVARADRADHLRLGP